MATLSPTKVTGLAGATPSYGSAAGGGDKFLNNGSMLLHVKNGDGSSHTVTVVSPELCSQGVEHDVTVTVGASGEKIIGPFDPVRFNDANGYANISYSAVTSVTVGVLQL